MKIDKIQDDGERFIIDGTNIHDELQSIFDNIALGVTVSKHEDKSHVLYTENNRDIVLRILNEKT